MRRISTFRAVRRGERFLVAVAALWATVTLAVLARGDSIPGPSASRSSSGAVDVIQVNGAITPITVQQIAQQIARSDRAGARALVLVIDTPGGLESSMRDIVKEILASPIPVISYVAPPGARAASAGLFLVTASHVAAMAPNTNLGAASPVAMGGAMDTTMAKKAVSDAAALIQGLAETRGRNVEWNVQAVRQAVSASAPEAVRLRVVDFIARDLTDLFAQANGRTVTVGNDRVTLDLAGVTVHELAPSFRHRVLSWLADPNVAYLMLTLGFYGILFELQSPGSILPGVAGAIFMILGLVALQTLPVNLAGLLLMILALVFFVLEVKVTSGGVLGAGGAISFFIGSLILFDPGWGGVFRVSLTVVAGATLATVAFFSFVVGKALSAQRRRVTTGAEGLIGARGEALSALHPRGQVRVHGELWQGKSVTPIAAGVAIEVVRVDGLTLDVREVS
jgi:membrane-bound serine protease (ClpP class)